MRTVQAPVTTVKVSSVKVLLDFNLPTEAELCLVKRIKIIFVVSYAGYTDHRT